MQTLKTNWLFLAIAQFILIVSSTLSCNQNPKTAQPLPDGIGDYIAAFTSGVISREGNIQVVFNANVVTGEEIGSPASEKLMEISPKIEGNLSWEDAQTLVFQPKNLLASNQSYVVTIHLDEVYDQLPKELESFQFDFKTRDLGANFKVNHIAPANPDQSDVMVIYGKMSTTDIFEDEGIHNMLSAKQDGQNLPIIWEEGRAFSHGFTIKEIKRKETPSQVIITLDESLLGKKSITRDTIEVPSFGDFQIINTQVVSAEEQYIQITFSDPLLRQQDLRGLIQIKGITDELKYLINGNQLKIYPASRLSGEHEIMIEPGISNTRQGKLKNPSRRILAFEAIKPSVRLVGSGNIVPGDEGLTFPFEAVGLTAIEVEIFKIYQNNVLQFLQTNNLNGSYDLERVGKIVHQEKVPLQNINPGADAANWGRYALDLSKMFKKDPKAIYQLRIGFRPEYTAFYCPGNETEDANLARVRNVNTDGEELTSIMDGWYGINGYYPEYRWEDREDPCKPAYYNRDRFVQRNLFSSNLAIIAKEGDNHEMFVVVNEILTTEPVGSAEVSFYNYQQQLISSATTNSAGMVTTQLPEKPFAILVKKGNESGFLKLGDGNSLSVSKFEVAGARKQKGLKGFLYGERGVWRPGDSLFINFILDDQENSLPEFHPVKYTLKDARGQVKVKGVETNSIAGFYPLHMATQPDDPTGNWRLEVEVGGARFQKMIKVETVKPNRLKVKLDFGNEYLTGKDTKVKGDLQVNWLHGAPGKNLKAITEVQLTNKSLNFKPYNQFSFWDPTRNFNPPNKVAFEGKTDEKGSANINTTLLENVLPPAMLSARFKTRAFEPGGNFSTDLFSMDYYPYDAYAGVRLPQNKWGQSRAETGKESQFEVVVVDKDGKPLKNRKVSLGIYEINWSWWWDQSQQRMAQYNSTNHFNALMRNNLQTDNEGKAKWPVTLERSGRYMVRVCDDVSQHCSGQSFYVGYPWYRDDEENTAKKEASMLAFTAKKEKYEVGETVELEVPSGDIGKLLLSLEGGSKIMDTKWQDVVAGSNTISFTATEDMVPTVYAHIALIQPHGQVENDHPIRMYGVIPIEIENKKNILEPVLEMPSTLRPEQKVTVQVSEKEGKEMAYTIAMVDEGLLDLTRFSTPDPYKAIYAKEALGIRTWDVYDEILGAYGGRLESILGVGGDGEAAPSDAKRNANRFKPVVRHLGPFYLKKGQKAKHEITLPNYVGSVRTMIVAGKDGAYGSTDKTTPVKKPVMVLATLPRVLGPGEKLKLPVNVFAMENKIKNVKVTVKEVNGIVDFEGSTSRTINFSEPDEKMAYFDFTVKKAIGPAKFEIKAEGNGESASQIIEIFVRNPNPPQRDVQSQVLNPGDEITLPTAAIGIKGTNTGYLEVSRFPSLDFAGKYDHIIRYPHGCLEQTTSAAFAQLYVDKAVKLDDIIKQDLKDNINAGINRLKYFLSPSKGFSYWAGSRNYYNTWSTIYATHFLTEAKNLGYTVDGATLDGPLNFLEKSARLWDPEQYEEGMYGYGNSDLVQAYRLFVLALAERPELGAMNRLRESSKLSDAAKWRLAAAYAIIGKKEVASQLVTPSIPEIPQYRDLSGSFGSDFRDQCMIIESLYYMGKTTEAFGLVQDLAKRFNENRYYSTQEIGYLFLSIGKLMKNAPDNNPLEFNYAFDNGKANQMSLNENVILINLPIDTKNPEQVRIKNNSNNVLFVSRVLNGRPMAGQEKAGSENLELAIKFYNMDGNTIDPTLLDQGTDFKAVIEVKNNMSIYRVLREMELTQIFPSGWEITNSRFEGMSNTQNQGRISYEEFKDDRIHVYYNLNYKNKITYEVQLNAAYAGNFYLPATTSEAMYNPEIYASTKGKWVTVQSID